MSYQFLKSDDIDSILLLYKDNFKDGWTKSMLESAFSNGRFLAIGQWEEQRLIALITISLTQFDADVEGIVIDKEYRRKGIAKSLLAFSEKILKERGIEKIFLEVRFSNEIARKLYLNSGYEELSIRKKYYSDCEDAIVMAKEI